MKKHLDFTLFEDKYYKAILRIYPRSTSIHSFNETPPTKWEEVYKVYYSWAIVFQYLDDETGAIEQTKKLFEMPCDENSRIPDLADIIRDVMSTKRTASIMAMGQPAAEWEISYKINITPFDGKQYDIYYFSVFDNWYSNGYRFWLTREDTERFIKWLDETNDYLFKHCGQPC